MPAADDALFDDADDLTPDDLLDSLDGDHEQPDDDILERFGLPFTLALTVKPRPYQRDAIRALDRAGAARRGGAADRGRQDGGRLLRAGPGAGPDAGDRADH